MKRQPIKDFVRRKISRGFEQSLLPSLAEKEYQKLREELNTQKIPNTIWDVFDMLSEVDPEIERPVHLRKYIETLQTAMDQDLRIVFAAPPQHGKSFASLVALIFFCLTQGGYKHCYLTYNETRANDVMTDFKYLLKELGVKYSTKNGAVFITPLTGSKKKSGVKFTSIHGGITGYSIKGLALLDDVIKGDEAANSPRQLEQTWGFFLKELRTRQSKRFSVVCMMTRWSVKDLSGKLINELKYEYIRLPAICDSVDDPHGRRIGEALWPEHRPIEQLQQTKLDVGSQIFESMYQGNPTEQGATPIKSIGRFHDDFGSDPVIYSYGIDLSYSGNKKSDYCAIVCIETNLRTGKSHLTRCMRRQSLYREFIEDVKLFTKTQPGNIYFCAGGYEEETSGEDFRRAFGGRMKITQAIKNKYTRLSQSGAIVAFNENWLLLPLYHNEQLKILEEQLLSFSGADLGPGTDDYVDCVSAAYTAVKHVRLNLNAPKNPTGTTPKRELQFNQKQRKLISSNSSGRRDNSI